MIRKVLSILAVLSMNLAFGQDYIPFPLTNANWISGISFSIGDPNPDTSYIFYKTIGETTINDTLYTMISGPYTAIYGYMREEGHQVYFRYAADQPEFLLYDFDMQEGEEVELPMTNGMSLMGKYTSMVESVDSILIGSEYHRRINISSWLGFEFIEGVGSAEGLLYCELPWVDWYGSLSCFSHEGTIYETDGSGESFPGDCWMYLGLPETEVQAMEIYPNPASNQLNIKSNENHILQLFDLRGIKVRESMSNSMDLEGLRDGMYVLKVLRTNGQLLHYEKVNKISQ